MRNIIKLYLWCKERWSRLNDWIKCTSPRKAIPTFASPFDAAQYLITRAKYVSDPLNGAADWYVHPERLQYALQQWPEGTPTIPGVDCDDYSSWAYAALKKIPGCTPQMLTLYDASGHFGHHVICSYTWQHDDKTELGIIDTNGLQPFPTLEEEVVCRYFSIVYQACGYRYTAAIPTAYPF